MSPRLPKKPATIRGKNRLRFQIVGITNHAKTRVIVGLQPSDIKIYRTDVGLGNELSWGDNCVCGESYFGRSGTSESDMRAVLKQLALPLVLQAAP